MNTHGHYLRNVKGYISAKVKGKVFLRLENDNLFIHIYFLDGTHFESIHTQLSQKIDSGITSQKLANSTLHDFECQLLDTYFISKKS